MNLLLYFCIIILIPHIRGKNELTPLKKSSNTNDTLESQIKGDSANSKVTLNTEGGSVKPQLHSLSLPEETHSILTNLDKEIEKPKGKSVVPRKGVHYDSVEDNLSNLNHTKERIDTTVSNTTILDTKEPVQSSTTKSVSSTAKDIKLTTNHSQSTTPKVSKKPLVLSSEAISETDRRVQMEKAKTESSSTSFVSDQIVSPNVKYEPVVHSSHPDLVMPIVISMLVVPMFAVLGYMALRRGQEAWKNRHYKRMDFLLDGMYND